MEQWSVKLLLYRLQNSFEEQYVDVVSGPLTATGRQSGTPIVAAARVRDCKRGGKVRCRSVFAHSGGVIRTDWCAFRLKLFLLFHGRSVGALADPIPVYQQPLALFLPPLVGGDVAFTFSFNARSCHNRPLQWLDRQLMSSWSAGTSS